MLNLTIHSSLDAVGLTLSDSIQIKPVYFAVFDLELMDKLSGYLLDIMEVYMLGILKEGGIIYCHLNRQQRLTLDSQSRPTKSSKNKF